ncbi:hypothetical protein GCM10010219_40220 [Streptomyces netropsis]|nr:hypothetical protein GCM10010219_40220 [Streptomyces netropsis]
MAGRSRDLPDTTAVYVAVWAGTVGSTRWASVTRTPLAPPAPLASADRLLSTGLGRFMRGAARPGSEFNSPHPWIRLAGV